MLEILLVLIAMLVMARRPRRRRRRWTQDMQLVAIQGTMGLSTLGSLAAIAAAATNTSDNEFRAISVKATWSLRDLTAGEGPISVGLSHGDYTAAEIEEFIEAEGAMTRLDKIAQEQANRLIRRVGTFSGLAEAETLNDGRPIRTKLNWAIADGGTVDFWAYNHSGAVLTTGAVVEILGRLFLRWT